MVSAHTVGMEINESVGAPIAPGVVVSDAAVLESLPVGSVVRCHWVDGSRPDRQVTRTNLSGGGSTLQGDFGWFGGRHWVEVLEWGALVTVLYVPDQLVGVAPSRLITDVQDLEMTLDRVVIRDADGDIFERQGELATERGTFAAWLGTHTAVKPSFDIPLPATVIYIPGEFTGDRPTKQEVWQEAFSAGYMDGQSHTVPTRDEIAKVILMVTQGENIDPKYAWNSQFPEVQDELLEQADAVLGLLHERNTRTVPTREEIAETIHVNIACQNPHCDGEYQAADAVLALLDGQPTIAEVQARALEEAVEIVEAHRNYRREAIGRIDDDTTDPLLLQAHDSGSSALIDARDLIRVRAQQARGGR